MPTHSHARTYMLCRVRPGLGIPKPGSMPPPAALSPRRPAAHTRGAAPALRPPRKHLGRGGGLGNEGKGVGLLPPLLLSDLWGGRDIRL